MYKNINLLDDKLKWYGTVSKEMDKKGLRLWRIEYLDENLYSKDLIKNSRMPTGIKLILVSNTRNLILKYNKCFERSPIDLIINGKFKMSSITKEKTVSYFKNLSNHFKIIEVWLPQFGEFILKQVLIDDKSELSKYKSPKKPKWITYGSSITQCKDSLSPSKTWPAVVARKRNYDLTCLGYGGQCHLDILISIIIRDMDADLISLCLGINIYGSNSLNKRSLFSNIIGFINIIREKHFKTPIVLISPIYSPRREKNINSVGLNLKKIRLIISDIVKILYQRGDKNIYYINGLKIFNSKYKIYLYDDLHPNDKGYDVIARNMLKYLPQL